MNRLRELRRSKGLTSIQLGDILGLSDSSVRFIERGDRGFSMESLKRACEYFGVSADYLLGVEPEALLTDFVASIKRNFYVTHLDPQGEATEGLSSSVPDVLALKLEAILALSTLSSQGAIEAVYKLVKLEQAKEEFGGTV